MGLGYDLGSTHTSLGSMIPITDKNSIIFNKESRINCHHFRFGGKGMNRTEPVRALSKELGLTLSKAYQVLGSVLIGMIEALEKSKRVEIQGLGLFSITLTTPKF